MTVHAQVTAAWQRLRAAGIGPEEATLSARLLAQELLGWDAARFFTAANQPEPEDFPARYEALVARRAAREPLPYITGRREFWNLSFEVSPAVLIPRHETEVVVEIALELFPDRDAAHAIADACTGSGCLAVAMAREYVGARVVATDLSADALLIARRNAVRHDVADRIALIQTNVLGGILRRFDLIVANPPYVSDRDQPALQPEVRDHEPEVALFGGGDGLFVIRTLLEQAIAHLKLGGFLVFEFGFWQGEAVSDLISSTPGLTMTEVRPDLQGIPRAAVAQRVS